MQINKVKSEQLKREYDITIAAGEINKKIDQKLEEIAEKAKFPGFRQGKAPLTLVKKNYGKSVVNEVLEQVINQTSVQALEKEGVRPALRPQFEIVSFKENDDLTYKMKLEVFPEVPDVDLKSIKLEKLKAEAGDDEVNEGLNRIARSYKDFSKAPDSYKSKKGDAVLIDFIGRMKGKAFDGGTANDYQLELGSNTFIEGFEEQLIGKKAGDKVDVSVTFPKNYGKKEYAGKPAVFEVTVKEVRTAKDQPVDEDFAKKLGMESLDKLRDAIRKQIESDFEAISRTLLKKNLFDKLEGKCKFPIPEEMTELEFQSIWHQVQQAIKRGEIKNKKEADLKKEYREMAERRVKLGIFLSEYGIKNNIKVANEDLSRAIMQKAQQFPGSERKVLEFYTKNAAALDELRGPLLEDKVVDEILAKVETKEKIVDGKKLIEEGDKLQEEETFVAAAEDDSDEHMHVHGPDCDHEHHDHDDPHHVHGPGCNH